MWVGNLSCQAGTFRVATYNLAGYWSGSGSGRQAKSEESKRAVRQMILAAAPDVIALQEIGGPQALTELRESLRSAGLDLPHSELVTGADTNIHMAILSRYPFARRQPHTNDVYLLGERRFRVGRGFAEAHIQISPSYSFTLLSAHLKSKRAVPMADESEQRLAEARLLRQKVDARLAADPEANLLVMGDLNDGPSAASTRAVLGKGRTALQDTRPTEHHPGSAPDGTARAGVAWTYYYAREDTYSRVDFLLVSRGMSRELVRTGTYVLAAPQWSEASDHRPLIATFEAEDR